MGFFQPPAVIIGDAKFMHSHQNKNCDSFKFGLADEATFNGRNNGKVAEYILFRSGGLVQLTDGDDDDGQMDQYSKFRNLWVL